MKLSTLLATLLLVTGCSFTPAPNAWQGKSASAFDSYTKNFLRGADALAKSDLQRAVEHAKSSAQLESLARIYLGACALNLAVGKNATCHDFDRVQEVLDDPRLQAYEDFISMRITSPQIEALSDEYQKFAWHVNNMEYDKAYESLEDAKITSKLLGYALIREHLNLVQKEQILEEASFYGYKKAVLFWIDDIERSSEDETTKNKMKKMKEILASK